MKLVICGGPRVGKTTLASRIGRDLGCTPRSTDALIGKTVWGDDSHEVGTWFGSDAFIIEGVTTARALRKWMAANPGKPCDKVVFLGAPVVEQTPGQQRMAKGVTTVFTEILPELEARGVVVEKK